MTQRIMRMLLASDPGLRRLRTACHATITWIVVVGVLTAVAGAARVPSSAILPGMLVVSAATVSLGMPLSPRDRTLAILGITGSAAVSLLLATVTATSPVGTMAVFLGVAVSTLGLFLLGHAYLIVGIGAIVSFYAATLAGPTWETLPVTIASAAIGSTLSAFFLGWVFRERPASEAPRLLKSVGAAAQRLGTAQPATRRRRQRDLSKTVLEARTHIGRYPNAWPESLRRQAGGVLTRVFSSPVAAAHTLSSIPASDWPTLRKLRAERPVPNSDPGGRGTVSMGMQLLAACVLALTAALLLDARNWFWCVLAALVMLFGTSSVADSVGKGARRVAGTAIALPVALLLGAALENNTALVIPVALFAMFMQQYLADVAYGWSVFFLTLLISSLLELSGTPMSGALGTRLILTVLGALIGAAVSIVVLPTWTGPLLRGRSEGALQAGKALIDAVVDGRDTQTIDSAVLTAFRRTQLLSDEAEASARGWPLHSRRSRKRVHVSVALEIVTAMRNLVILCPTRVPITEDEGVQLRRISDLIEQIRVQLARGSRGQEDGSDRHAGGDHPDISLTHLERYLERLSAKVGPVPTPPPTA